MKFKNLSLFLVCFSLIGCGESRPFDPRSAYLKYNEAIANTIVAKLINKNLKNLTIPRFESMDGEHAQAGDFLADRLTADITHSPDAVFVNLINREKMDKILDEQKLKAAGILNRNTVIEKGNMLGIDAVVIGKYQVTNNIWGTPNNLSVTYELVDIEKGITVYANTINLPTNTFPEVAPYCQ